jgi:glycosyltransferase involved in cell wall biosynthesis
MKILFIAYGYLDGNGGGVFASRAYINSFAELADEITLLYPMTEGKEPSGINANVKMVPIWDTRNDWQKGIGLLLGRSNRFRTIRKVVGEEFFDIVVLNNSMVVQGVLDYFKKKGSKIITIHHNYNYEYFRDNTKFPLSIPILYWTRRFEGKAVRESDLNLTLTEADKILLLKHYGRGGEKIEVLGTYEYERKVHPLYKDVKTPRFLITGNLSAMQTENSLIPWIEDYYPILKGVFPEATLTLAGKDPSSSLIQRSREHGIIVIPSPDSMQPILADAKYYICATSLGGGLKLRVMDGLSAGLPVVCHAVSARGYEPFVEQGVLLVYEDKASFKNQLIKLKTITIKKQNTIELFEKIFSFESGKKRLSGFLNNYFSYNTK